MTLIEAAAIPRRDAMNAKTHRITPRKAGKYTICDSCYRGIVEEGGEWFHIRRKAWKPEMETWAK
jgi:hypothetical protein